MWGVGAIQRAHYMVLIIGIGITIFGVVCASAISLAYAVDYMCHQHHDVYEQFIPGGMCPIDILPD